MRAVCKWLMTSIQTKTSRICFQKMLSAFEVVEGESNRKKTVKLEV